MVVWDFVESVVDVGLEPVIEVGGGEDDEVKAIIPRSASIYERDQSCSIPDDVVGVVSAGFSL